MARNSIRGGGDALARGARSMQFAAGGAKKDDKIQINKGILASPETAKELDKIAAAADNTVAEKPVMKRTARPLYDRILVRRATVDEITKGGIVIPEEAKDRPSEGTVVRIGKGKRDINGILWPLDVKEGDTVLFGRYAGTEIKIDGEIVLMMSEGEILATIE